MRICGFEFLHHVIVSVQTVVDEDPNLAEPFKQAGKNVAGVTQVNVPGSA